MIPNIPELSAVYEEYVLICAGKGSPSDFEKKYVTSVVKGFRQWLIDNPLDPIKPYEWRNDLHPDKAENERRNIEDQEEHYQNEVRHLRQSAERALHAYSKNMQRLNRDIAEFHGNEPGTPPANPYNPRDPNAKPENPYGEEEKKETPEETPEEAPKEAPPGESEEEL